MPSRKRARLDDTALVHHDSSSAASLPFFMSEQTAESTCPVLVDERLKGRTRSTRQLHSDRAIPQTQHSCDTVSDGPNGIALRQPFTPPASHLDDEEHEDELFAKAVLEELQQLGQDHDNNFGLRQITRISQLLQKATRATQEEGPWLTAEQACQYVRPGYLHKGPIFVEAQQSHALFSVKGFLSELFDDAASIWVQDAAATDVASLCREVTVADVKNRLSTPSSEHPWNCLELACPIEDGIRPSFLNTTECRLLSKIKYPQASVGTHKMKAGRQVLEPGYKEAERWALLAEAGALTE